VGDEEAHAAFLGERKRFLVVGLAILGIEPVGMGRDVAEQVQSVAHEIEAPLAFTEPAKR